MQDLLDISEIPEKASAGIRYLSTGLDYLFVMVPMNMFYPMVHRSVLFVWVFVFIWIIYFPIIEGITGQTLGKRIFKLKVLKDDFSKISIFTSFLRRIFDVIDFFPIFGIFGIIIASSNSKTQRIGDLIAKTIVVKK